MGTEFIILGILILVLLVLQIVLLIYVKRQSGAERQEQMSLFTNNVQQELARVNDEIHRSIQSLVASLSLSQQNTAQMQDIRLKELNEQLSVRTRDLQQAVSGSLQLMDRRLSTNAIENEQKLNNIRKTMEDNLSTLREENSKKLDEMRATVDEKLQKTLEERIGQSFRHVSERLEQVYKGLGEMQALALGIGDLKKILSNVKTRGIMGEIQLGAILEQIMPREQYEENVAVRKGAERVEFAIRLPGDGDGVVYLPIDAKFPADMYARLMDAYDTGNKDEIEAAKVLLQKTIKSFAKSIHDKYIEPPYTTDFGIMFLPFEGLYAEVVRQGLVEPLQREYKISIAGPTTMASLLNSFQMGFRTLAIQRRSSEVWNVLSAVKTEFEAFGGVLSATQRRLTQANEELDKLVGVRTRAIQRKLREVESLPESENKDVPWLNAAEME